MIADLKPYPEYRDSELPWLGKFPATWKMLRGKSVFGRVDVRSKTGMEELLTVSANHGVIPRRQTSVTMFMAKSYIGHKLCWPGDLVVNSLWAWMQGLGVAKNHGLISSAYSVYRPRAEYLEYGNFFHHLFRSDAYKWELQTRSKGVWISRLQLTDIAFMDMPVLLPPPDEQAAIVRFLNHATLRIEKAIRAKQKVIALLNEQKQVIIHRAVTRGLDPNVKLKPSGIPWLGDIPEHWELIPLKGVCLVQSGITLGKYYGNLRLKEYPYLRVANVQSGHLNLRVVKRLQLPSSEARRSLLAIGDVLMTEGGDPDKLGRGCVWDGQIENCVHQNHVFSVRPNVARLKPHYLSALLGSNYAKTYFLLTAKQTTNLASTNKTTIGRFRVPLPSIAEQQKILDGLEELTSPISLAISRTEREIDLLREYRTRLIADVVTGKLDVREAAAALPDEVEELAILQDSDETAELDVNGIDAEDES